jgi:hypothetical protein
MTFKGPLSIRSVNTFRMPVAKFTHSACMLSAALLARCSPAFLLVRPMAVFPA